MPKAQFRPGVPLFLPLAALIAGIIAGSLTSYTLWSIVIPAASVFIFAALRMHYISILSIIVSAGALLAAMTGRKDIDAALDGHEATYSGIILERSDKSRTTSTVILIDSVSNASGTMQKTGNFNAVVYFFDSHLWLSPGQRIRFNSKLSATTHTPSLPDDPDLLTYYRYKEISATGIVFADQVYAAGNGSAWRTALDNLRKNISSGLYKCGIKYDCAAFLEAILLGNVDRLDQDIRDNFSLAGLSHILALSGTHVAIIALLVSIALFPLHLLGYRRTALILSVLFLFFYAFLTGLSASVVRSVVMASVVILGILCDRSRSPLNSLCFAAILILCFKPSELFSPGMQMSFTAVASILMLANALNPVSQRNRFLFISTGFMTVTIAAVAGTWIIACHYFHYIPLWFLPANIPMVFLIPVEIAAGAVQILLNTLGIHTTAITAIIEHVYSAISWVASSIAAHPASGIRDIFINPWCMPLYFTGLYTLSEALRTRSRHYFALATSLFVATWGIAVIPHDGGTERNRWYITHDNSWTDIVIYNGNEIRLATTAWRETADETVSRFTSSHSGFLSRRKIKTPSLLHEPNNTHSRQRQILSLGCGTTLAIAGAPADTCRFAPLPHSTYTLISRNSQNMTLHQIGKHYNPDTILIAHEVYPSVHDRLVTELKEAGLPYISLRDHHDIFSRNLKRIEGSH